MKNKVIKTDWRDIGDRAVKTWVQAFVATAGVVALAGVDGWGVVLSVLVASAAAGVSAVWNFIKETL